MPYICKSDALLASLAPRKNKPSYTKTIYQIDGQCAPCIRSLSAVVQLLIMGKNKGVYLFVFLIDIYGFIIYLSMTSLSILYPLILSIVNS